MRKNIPSSTVSFTFRSIYFRACFLVFVVLMFISFASYSQARLIEDLVTEAGYFSEPHNLIAAGDAIYFTDNGVLWKSNGKPAGTERLASLQQSNESHLTYSNGSVFFISDDRLGNWALWKTNGTPAGTVKVKTIAPLRFLPPDQLVDINGMLFFVATTESRGRELWRSDGTTAGTVNVKDIRRGSGGSEPGSLTYLRGKLFFSADDGVHGRELWSSDGTFAGTTLFKDIRPGSTLGSDPSELTNVRGTLYFAASDGTTGQELWKSNGTTGGTVFVKDIHPGPESSGIENITEVNGQAFFSANDGIHGDELWKSNGSMSGTVLVKDLNPGSEGSNSTDPSRHPMGAFTSVNGILYFTASKNEEDYIYRSNGTAAGTWIIQRAYSADSEGFNPGFVNINDYVYFFNATGPEMYAPYVLWRLHYKGTRPVAIKQFEGHEGFHDAHYQELLRFKGSLYFFVRPIFDLESYRLMISDGTTAGTRVLEDPRLSSRPAEMVRVNDLVYIRTSPNTGDYGQLYRTDGTAGGTFAIDRMSYGQMMAIGNKLFYHADERYSSSALFVTEGTHESTQRLLDGSVAGRVAYPLAVVGGSLYYANDDGELWRTNGTPGDQVLIGHVSNVVKMDDVNGQAFIQAASSDTSLELWRTGPDGPPVHIKTILTNYPIDIYGLPRIYTASIGDVFYFLVREDPYGEAIWRSDGTASGTYRMIGVRDLVTEAPLTPEDHIRALTVFNNQLYFSAISEDNRWSWYQVLGDESFTQLKTIPPVIHTVVHNNLMYIIAEPVGKDPNVQLWVSDGTARGTRFIRKFKGGGAADHSIIGNIIYFSTAEGTELIRSNGTECGTFPVNTGVDYAFPVEALGSNLLFGAFTPSTGMEPFIYRAINTVVPPDGCEGPVAANVRARSSDILTPYPNPFASEFTLRVNTTDPNPITVAVFTTSGFPVETFSDIKANTDYPDVGARWPEGMYIVKVHAMGRISTHLVVKR